MNNKNNTTLADGSCRFFDDLIVPDKLATYVIPALAIPKIALRVKKVIVQPNKQIVIVIFPNGDKSIAKCGKDDVFSVEKGVAIAISKYVLGSGSEFKRLVENATIQEAKKKEGTVTNNATAGIPSWSKTDILGCKMPDIKTTIQDSILGLGNPTPTTETPNDKIEVGDIVEITSVDIFPEIPTKSELGKLGEVIYIYADRVGVQTEYVKKVYDEDSFWVVSPKALKLIKKKEGK